MREEAVERVVLVDRWVLIDFFDSAAGEEGYAIGRVAEDGPMLGMPAEEGWGKGIEVGEEGEMDVGECG